MNEFWMLMAAPLAACLVLTGIHAYLGIHVLEREIIFVDLALAQIAALGASVALLLHLDLHDPQTYWFSLGATILGAAIFAFTRTRRGRIPQEAVIGIVYAVAAAAAVLALSRTAEGDEHIRQMLVGDILLVTPAEVWKMAVLYSLVGFLHWRFRRVFVLISTQPEEAYRQKISVKFWDFLFYATFGVVVTSSVQIAGVLLVFSFLIVPSVSAMLFSDRFGVRLILGWSFGVLASLAGIIASYALNLPTGAATVCAFGLLLLLLAMGRKILSKAA